MRTRWYPSRVALDLVAVPVLWGIELQITWDRAAEPDVVAPWVVVLAAALLYLPLFWRRRRPLAVLLLVTLGAVAVALLGFAFHPIFCVWLALFAVAAHCSRRKAALGLATAFLPVATSVHATVQDTADPSMRVASFLVAALFLTVAHLVVFGVGRWVRWSVAQRELVARLAAARAEAEERQRIARELHDVVAHAVSLMVLQAGGAERVMDRDPDRARAALRQVDELGEQAVTELRRMLGLLSPAPSARAAPEPVGLQRLDGLLDHLRAAGRDVELCVAGEPGALEPAVDEAAYRIAQEALTNAVKHAAPDRPVRVALDWGPREVELSVRTDGAGARGRLSARLSTGHGVRGMAERARAVGGAATAGPDPHGGYLVSARLPTRPAGPQDTAPEDAAPEDTAATTAATGRGEGTG
ncbi:sensor histidine kinase [uncultured Kocuria sp.]|uniref:sensor histidine kinase n=1 Tax=uncultured Kocuria sp. TaxID=259305 RepID=UPI00261937AE|nr:histidine kinase [uncultured Kocuria sp.]